METKNVSLLNDLSVYIDSLFEENLAAHFHYHNLDHTRDVVKAAQKIGELEGLNEKELEIVQVAAWFHDVGYIKTVDDHEEVGSQMAKEWMEPKGYTEEEVQQVQAAILATKLPQNPETRISEILCDADMIHLTKKSYLDKCDQMRTEFSTTKDLNVNDKQWLLMNESFIMNHKFFTEAANEKYKKKVKKNLKKVRKKIDKIEQLWATDKIDVSEKDKSLKGIKLYRGMETMFRVMARNHLELSSMADNKANIMISINSIIISILITVMFRKFEDYPHFIIPTIILTMVCLLTIIFSVLSTRPNVTTGKFSKEDIADRSANLLFFGNFHQMDLDSYEWGMREVLSDPDYLYGSMIRDNFFLGNVLGKKYRRLRVAYSIFMFGFVGAILSYGLAGVLYNQ
jgi:predicted metal-dependent HD superfamily phosphohydrolase